MSGYGSESDDDNFNPQPEVDEDDLTENGTANRKPRLDDEGDEVAPRRHDDDDEDEDGGGGADEDNDEDDDDDDDDDEDQDVRYYRGCSGTALTLDRYGLTSGERRKAMSSSTTRPR